MAFVENSRHEMYRHYLTVGQAEHVGSVFHIYPRVGVVAVEAVWGLSVSGR
jgi:hypothetical protein